ncbi:SUMF1/EgtB/PvdO family nonheme iron enzyme [Cyanobacteria bacterium FACHB-63]|nr:SUMF1/EgtB/PvdO family nonheme iron enzyme [Cyanobacteria bacterium FACHB-63]
MKRLVAALEQKFPDLTAEEIADILWLTLQQWQLQQTKQTTSSPTSQSDSERTNEPPPLPVIPSVSSLQQTKSDRASPEPSPSMAGVTTQRPSTSSQSTSSTAPGAALALPDTRSLHQSLEILKALRSLIRQVPSGDAKHLDISATVRAIADTDVWLLKLRPALETWLELAIVVDTSASMVIWQRTILDLRRVLAQSGVFRDVRLWSLEAQEILNGTEIDQTPPLKSTSQLSLYLRPGFGPATVKPPPCRPQELLDPSKRRLIIVVSDCIASYWDTYQMRSILQLWGDHGPMALMQVLPEWLWSRTALLEVALGQVVGSSPGQENRSLTFVRRGRWQRKPPVGVRVPVVTLDPTVVARWSQMIAGNASVPAPGLLFSPAQVRELLPQDESEDAEASARVLTPSERLEQFRNFSSPMARRLAGLLAACPEVSLPIVRMIQTAMLPGVQQVHVAEVLLGGLFKSLGEVTAQTPADEVQYVFHSGVQLLVQHTIPPEQSFKALSTWIQRRFGYSLEDFRAYITPERIAQIKPFAGVLLDVLKRRRDQYVEVISEIEAEFRPRYTSAVELTQQETASKDYEILTRQGTSEVVVIAIHGGNLQPGTTEIADAVAGGLHSFYSFVSLKPEIDQTLYIASTQFDEQIARRMVRNARTVLSIHGCKGDIEFIRVGGADRDRIETIISELTREGFRVDDDRSSGTHPNNICNRGLTGRGVQIEVSRGLRNRLVDADGQILEKRGFKQLVNALQRGLKAATLPQFSEAPPPVTSDNIDSINLEPSFPELQTLEFETAQLIEESIVLRPGIAIKHPRGGVGTLGCFVRKRGQQQLYILSVSHILAPKNIAKAGDPIIRLTSPTSEGEQEDVIATLAEYFHPEIGAENQLDVAIAAIQNLPVEAADIRGIGTLRGAYTGEESTLLGKTVRKLGARSGVTQGTVSDISADIRMSYEFGNITLENLIGIESPGSEPFTESGDSGAIVIDEEGYAIGILVGGTISPERGQRSLSFAIPLQSVLDALSLELVLDSSTVSFPPLETQEVEVITIVSENETPETDIRWQLLEYEVATVERRSDPPQTEFLRNIFRQGDQRGQWSIRKQRQQRVCLWIERLTSGVDLEMVLILGRSFVMGSPENEPERFSSEGPQHEVSLNPFMMGRYPVTQAQWQAVAAMPQINRELDPSPSRFKGEKRPVERVSWYDAVEFCERLSAYSGREYRLPTEAEWEYACRAGTTTPFHFGETITSDLANYSGSVTYNDGPKGKESEETTPVDWFKVANAFGLCDMHGNVHEWCQDHWHERYEGVPIDGSAWLADQEDVSRVVRGGSWDLNPRYCRSAHRDNYSPNFRYATFGFRVVCSTPRTL